MNFLLPLKAILIGDEMRDGITVVEKITMPGKNQGDPQRVELYFSNGEKLPGGENMYAKVRNLSLSDFSELDSFLATC